MNELIIKWEDRETAIYHFTTYRFITKDDAVTAKMMLENHCEDKIRDIKIETLKQESLPKGKWIEVLEHKDENGSTWHYECSECGARSYKGIEPLEKYCPNCGIKMIGG